MKEIIKNFEDIYKSNILKPPNVIQLDKQFNNSDIHNYFEKKKIYVKIIDTAFHIKQKMVEIRNYFIGRLISMRQNANELKTGEKSTTWVNHLPKIIELMNKQFYIKPKSDKPLDKIDEIPKRDMKNKNKNSNTILNIGTKVRIQLNEPKNVYDDKKLHGDFRAGDIRWSKDIYIIKSLLIKPNLPVMYLTNKNDLYYTKNYLQVVDENEKEPPDNMIDEYTVEKIIKKVKRKDGYYYLIKWKGYKKQTYEKENDLIQDIPDMIEEFNNK